jgi:hypothetical protein
MKYVWRLVPQNYQNKSHHWWDKFSVWYQHNKHNFPFNLQWMELWLFYFYSDNRSPDGRDVQAGLTDWMVCQEPCEWIPCISCMWSGSICKTFASFHHILWPSLYTFWANFDFSSRPYVKHIGNCFNVRTIFKTIHTLHGILMKTGAVKEAQQTNQCVHNVPWYCGRCYIGETSRTLEVHIKEHQYNLT